MKLARRAASALLAPMFIAGGLDAVRRPEGKAGRASVVTDKVTETLGLDAETEQLVRLNGAVQLAGGVMLALGVLPRAAAVTLAASLVPTTLAGHRFWAETDPQARAVQRIQFFKNLAMLGGLVLVVAPSEPGFVERHRRHD
jgi:uncharacterized membrane protein YphA (DoxX/SURF4 family)